jgi:hypothetical protein
MTQDLQYRLNNYSIPPPEGAWPAIAAELDKESAAQDRIVQKLQAAALEPPPGVWEKIAGTLHGTADAKVIPIKKRWTRMAVAAIATGIIVLAGLSYFMLNGTSEQASVTPETNRTPNATNNVPQPADNVTTDPVVVYDNATTSNFLPVRTRPRMVPNNPVRYARVQTRDLAALEAALGGGVIDEPVATQPRTRIPPAQYLTIAAPNGQPARISAKLTDGLNYIFNNESTETMDQALRSIAWRIRFSNWSNKLLSSTGFIPTASNFMDIVELEELLKEQ